jgi:hypothetical protein
MVGSLMSNSVWHIASASAAGLAHLQQNTQCQDRLAHRTIETAGGEVLIAVVSDGAGSAEKGHCGAELACELFTAEVSAFLSTKNASVKSLSEEFGRRWVSYFQRKSAEVARKEGFLMGDYASTLVGAAVGTDCAVFYQIGDGGIVFSATGAPDSYLFGIAPQDALYVNMTDFITDEDAAVHLRYNRLEERVEDLILFSDGIFPVAVDYRSNQPHEPFLRPMITPLRNGNGQNGAGVLNEKLAGFLASPKLNEKTDDDKTIILASRAVLKKANVSAETSL